MAKLQYYEAVSVLNIHISMSLCNMNISRQVHVNLS